MAELPPDIIFKFFLWLPVKSLLRFRCVSKPWCKLIDDPYLATTRVQQGTEQPMLMMLQYNYVRSKTSWSIRCLVEKDEGIWEVQNEPVMELETQTFWHSSCNGLTCILDKNLILNVINPLTGEAHKLPRINSKKGVLRSWYGLGFDSCHNCYKVVVCNLLATSQHQRAVETMVHTLGTSSWRKISEAPSYHFHGESTFAHGLLHWLADQSPKTIVYFNVANEEFGVINLPLERRDHIIKLSLTRLNGELAVVDVSRFETFDLWILKDYQKEEWEKFCLEQPPGVSRRPLRHFCTKVLGVLNKDGDLLVDSTEGYFVYSFKTGLHHLQIPAVDTNSEILLYSGSLIRIRNIVADAKQ